MYIMKRIFALLAAGAAIAFAKDGIPTNVLKKPGDCRDHKDFPWTIQCAETKRCLSIAVQVNNSKLDCCGPGNEDGCKDRSDEDRYYADPGSLESLSDCRFEIPQNPALKNIFNKCIPLEDTSPTAFHACLHALIFRCLKTKRCLSRLQQASGDGECDCCGPEHTCGTCADHSDEDPCRPGQWPSHFSCDGKCLPLGDNPNTGPLYDDKMDCHSECVEANPEVHAACTKGLHPDGHLVSAENSDKMGSFCEELRRKGTPFYECPSQENLCILTEAIRKGPSICPNGEDNDKILHPDCDPKTKAAHCTQDTYQCIMVGKGEFIQCRCKKGDATGNSRDCKKKQMKK